MKNSRRILSTLFLVLILVAIFPMKVFATGDVAAAIEGTWNDASGQIKPL